MYAEFLTIEIALFKILHWFYQGLRNIRTEPLTLGSFIIGNPRLDFLKLLNTNAKFLTVIILLFKTLN
jgi:hypothetical protein